jgi:hypothetical protein
VPIETDAARDERAEDVTPALDRPGVAPASALALLAAVGVVIPVVISAKYGALDIPRADGWSYLHTLFHWRRTGAWDFNNWVSMTLVGQVLLATPVLWVFGYSVLAVHIAFAILGFGGLAALWWLGRVAGLAPWRSALVATSLAASPLWGPLAPTFMTDVPAFAFEMLALALACIALGRDRPSLPLLAASVGAGFVAISIRQYAAVPVVAILATAALHFARARDRRALRTVLVLAALTAVGTLALFAWWRTVPGGKALAPHVPSVRSLTRTYNEMAGFVRLAGVIAAPALLLAGPVRLVRRAFARDRGLAGWVVGLAAFWTATGYVPSRPLVGNYFAARGVLADNLNLPGTRPRIMPAAAFQSIAVVGALASIVLACAAVPWLADRIDDLRAHRWPTIDPVGALLTLTVAGFGAGYALALAVDEPIFDRYALPALPLVGILVLRTAAGRRVALAGVSLLALGLVGAAYTAESASFDGTRWKVAEAAVAAGFTPEQIAAGDEWIGWYRGDGPPTAGTAGSARKPRPEYYRGLCVSVLVDARSLPPNPIAEAWSRAPTRKPSRFVAYRNDRRCATTGDGKGP